MNKNQKALNILVFAMRLILGGGLSVYGIITSKTFFIILGSFSLANTFIKIERKVTYLDDLREIKKASRNLRAKYEN